MEINYSKQSEKFLNKQDNTTFYHIVTAISKLPNGDVKKMQAVQCGFTG